MNRRRLLWAAFAVLMAIAVSSCSNEQKAPQAPERPYIPQVYTAAGLQEAVKSGGTVKLGSDVTITVPAQAGGKLPTAAMEITRDTTINLNGKTLSVVQAPASKGASKISSGPGSVEDGETSSPIARISSESEGVKSLEDMYVLEVTSGTLTISGSGVIDGSGMKGIRVGDGTPDCSAHLVINGGEVRGKYVAVHLIGGRVAADISGGKFSVEKPWNDKRYVLNIQDEYAGDAKYNVTGGTFEGFNPHAHQADPVDGDAKLSYVNPGYYAELSGDSTYTVKQRPSGTAGYKVVWDQAGLEEAVKSDAQVLLGADIKLECSGKKTHGFLITENNVTLDLNGHKLTADKPGEDKKHYEAGGNMPYAILAVHNNTLTVNDSSSAKTGMIDGETGGYGGIWIHNGEGKNARLVFNNGFVRCADNAVYLSGEEAQAIIRGGKFWADEDTERNKYYTLNILDENAKGDSLASFTVTGGSFYNFDPAANFADSSKPDKTTCYIDTSKYHTVSSSGDGGTWYVVIPGAASN